MSDSVAARFCGVHFGYHRTPVLSDVHLDIPLRRISCIVGPNGGGKTTLLKLILGLVEPQSGHLEVLGCSPRKARARIGYMPQAIHIDPRFPIDVASIVLMGRLRGSLPGFFNREDRKVLDRVLEEVELGDLKRAAFAELSGGQKQRVLIARALATEPELLLLDEPTAMVDAHIEAQLLARLKELHQRMTIVLVSHDDAFVSELVDRVICVNRSVEEHPTEKVSDPGLTHLYGEKVKAVRHDHRINHHHHHHD
ncbi:MAG: ABC transporter ATP-binding protein [Opitutales bacterium]|nr:ABC transporter ATP-binding protein [Opitutales bacterium]